MSRVLSTFTAVAVAATMLTAVPARANDELVRFGLGVGAAILGEAIKNGRNGKTQPPPQSRQQPQARSGNRQVPPPPARHPAVALPAVGPALVFRPDPAEAVPVASSPISSEPVLEAAREMFGQAQEAPPHDDLPEVVSIEDEHGRVWGTVDGQTAVKIEQAVELGMSRSDAIAALTDLKAPKAEEPTAIVAAPVPVAAESDELPPELGLRMEEPPQAAEVSPAPIIEAVPEAVAVAEEPAPEPEPEKPLSLDIDL